MRAMLRWTTQDSNGVREVKKSGAAPDLVGKSGPTPDLPSGDIFQNATRHDARRDTAHGPLDGTTPRVDEPPCVDSSRREAKRTWLTGALLVANDIAVADCGRVAGSFQAGTTRTSRLIFCPGKGLGSHVLPVTVGQVPGAIWGRTMGHDRSARRRLKH